MYSLMQNFIIINSKWFYQLLFAFKLILRNGHLYVELCLESISLLLLLVQQHK